MDSNRKQAKSKALNVLKMFSSAFHQPKFYLAYQITCKWQEQVKYFG